MLARSIAKSAADDAYAHWYTSRPFDIGGTTSAALRPVAASPKGERLAIAAECARVESQANGFVDALLAIGIRRAPARGGGGLGARRQRAHPPEPRVPRGVRGLRGRHRRGRARRDARGGLPRGAGRGRSRRRGRW